MAHFGVESPCVTNVALELIGGEFGSDGTNGVAMNVDDMSSEVEVHIGIALVQDNEEQIEPRHDRGTHGDVGAETLLAVVPSSDGVGGGENGSTSIESCLDTSFGDRDRLLFHGFVDGDLIREVHLVELVDGANAVVGQHERSGFNRELSSLFILDDGSGETCSG